MSYVKKINDAITTKDIIVVIGLISIIGIAMGILLTPKLKSKLADVAENSIEDIEDVMQTQAKTMKKFTAHASREVRHKLKEVKEKTEDVKKEIDDSYKKAVKDLKKTADHISKSVK